MLQVPHLPKMGSQPFWVVAEPYRYRSKISTEYISNSACSATQPTVSPRDSCTAVKKRWDFRKRPFLKTVAEIWQAPISKTVRQIGPLSECLFCNKCFRSEERR